MKTVPFSRAAIAAHIDDARTAGSPIPLVPHVPEHWPAELEQGIRKELETIVGTEDDADEQRSAAMKRATFAFAATKLTAADLKALGETRGKYRKGDTRDFVLTHEQACLDYNCWMRRKRDGSVIYVSEP